jgi:hypothetical protein
MCISRCIARTGIASVSALPFATHALIVNRHVKRKPSGPPEFVPFGCSHDDAGTYLLMPNLDDIGLDCGLQ